MQGLYSDAGYETFALLIFNETKIENNTRFLEVFVHKWSFLVCKICIAKTH